MARAILSGASRGESPAHQLIESDRVEGTAVYDRNGKHIGSVARLMIDKASGRVAYVMVSFTKFLGLEEESYAVPWDALTYDTELGGYRTDITEDQVRRAPAFSREANFERLDRARERELHAYYGSRYYWESLS